MNRSNESFSRVIAETATSTGRGKRSRMQPHRGTLITQSVAVGLVALAVTASIIVALTFVSGGLFGGASTVTNPLSPTTSFSLTDSEPEFCTVPPCATPISGWLHTNPADTNIYDSGGNIVRLVGLNAMGLEYGTGTSNADQCKFGWGGEDAGGFSTNEFNNIAAWGFNFVRLPVSWENLEPTPPTQSSNGTWVHAWNAAYLSEIDYFVNQFGQKHIAVILDFHQLDISSAFQQAPGGVHGTFCEGWGEPTWLYPGITSPTTRTDLSTAICNFFTDNSMVGNAVPSPINGLTAAEQMLASRYSGNPTVIGIDMFNEPWFPRSCGPSTTADGLLMNFNAKVSEAISAANPHILIVFEDPPKTLMPSQATLPVLTAPPPVPNSVYEVHIYTSDWDTAQPLLQAYLNNAKKWGVPLYMGEFNAFYAGDKGIYATVDPNWQADTQTMLAFCKSNGISWSFWSYTSLGTRVPTPEPKTEILATLRAGI